MHFTATPLIPPTAWVLQRDSINGTSEVGPRSFTADLTHSLQPTHPLNPINPDNACILRITAAAGTELADAYSWHTLIGVHVHLIALSQKKFTTHRAAILHAAWLVQTSVH